MLAVAFDTLKLAKKLETGGMPAKQAESLSSSLSESFTETLNEWHSVGNLATKDDIQKLDSKIEKLDSKIEASKAELLKWLFIAVGSQTLIQLVALVALTHGGK
jgi:hypothetical protein